ncbi:F0F1 ATP synthase subunit B family protein [Desulfonema magnum]|uniref:ATP synthase subunit b n=1 Tax=Desulfonema magnum TaxID=45655 RepID=A0A975BUZ7_9BACT|nr:hypothetical protein [Desulfonema magnum]QTA91997.1 ATP synthase, subunit beta (ATP synthase F0 sector subunit b) [Desulfonema magnum]
MKKFNKTGILFFYTVVICLHILGTEALAAEEAGSSWRGTYDLIMLWLNFGILAFVCVKFGKKPLMDFLHGRKKEVADEISQVEKEKEQLVNKIKETYKVLDESEVQFSELKQKIVSQGEKKRQNIIEDAQRQSQIMLETSKQKIGSQILQAKSKFRSEMIDEAVALATERLPKEMSDEDDQKFVEEYITSAFMK